MNTEEVSFGEWLPDQADYKNPGCVVANNVYPASGGFQPFPTAVASDDTTSTPVIGARLFFRNDGNSIICGGTATTLFILTGGTLTSTNPPYTSSSSWRFERFNDLVIAVNKENNPQYLTDIDTDTTWSALTGSPPKASVIGKVSDFLVLGNVDGGTDVPNRVQWSVFNNPTATWGTDYAELSGFRDLDPRYGDVTGIVGGRWGLVFQKRAIWRMEFVGSPKVFEFKLVADDRGCIAPDSIVTIGYETYFLDQGGIFVTNGSEVAGVGDQRVNAWLDDNVDPARRNEFVGAINWPMRSIVWAFKKTGADGYNNQIIYSFVTEQFSTATQEVHWLVQSNQDALTLSDLASLFPSGLGSMSAYEIGTAEWQARDRVFAGFIASGNGSAFAPFTGANAEADITTGDMAIAPGSRALVDGVMPIVEFESGTMTAELRSRATQGASYAVTSAVEPGVDGYAPFHVDDWFHSVRTVLAAGSNWQNAKGLWVRARGSGRR